MLRRTLVLAVCLAFGDLLTSGAEPVGSIDCADDRGCRYGRLKPGDGFQGRSDGFQGRLDGFQGRSDGFQGQSDEIYVVPATDGSKVKNEGLDGKIDAYKVENAGVQGHEVSREDGRKDSGNSAVRIKVDDTGDARDFRGVLINRMRDDKSTAEDSMSGRYYESYQTATEATVDEARQVRRSRMELIRNVEGYIDTDQKKMMQNKQLDGSRMSRNIGEWFRTLNKGPRNRGDEGDLVESSQVSFNLGRIVRSVQRYLNESGSGKESSADGTWTSRMLGGFFDGLEQNSTEVSARKRGNKGKGYGKMIVYLAGAMKAWMLYVMIHAVGAIAGKALVVAKIALAVAIAVALKKSGESHDKTSVEIVKHPHHSYVQTHSQSVDYDHHGYGESGYGSHRRHRRRTYR